MANAQPIKGKVYENSAAVLIARVADVAGVDITQAGIASMSIRSFKQDATPPTPILGPTTLTVANHVFNTLQNDNRATEYNLAIALPGTYWPDPGKVQVELKVTPTAGDPYYVRWDLDVVEIFTE